MTSLRWAFAPSLLVLPLLLSLGCQRVHVGADDGGGGDAGVREICGPVTCELGQVCCNSSCGICTSPGQACTAIGCATTCASNADCGPSDYCAASSCGATGTCVPRPEECPALEAPVCGCDASTYGNSCLAAAAGRNVARDGACATSPGCDPMDARGVGDCPAIVGFVWDGRGCVMAGGCDCAGADCGGVYATALECETARAGCRSCTPVDAHAGGACAVVLGVFWDGAACVGQSGCSCAGADCGIGMMGGAECEVAYRHCAPPPGCTSDADCGAVELCLHPRGECSLAGTCQPRPAPPPGCFDPGPPVCGCDGVTYACDEMAHENGTSVAHDGRCGGACAAQDVASEGACDLFLGTYWDGSSCVGLSGCTCTGLDCGLLTPDPDACVRAHAGCERAPGGECGGRGGVACRPDEFCDYADGDMCGGFDALGRCRPRPDACTFMIDPVCGCDGAVHDNACLANMAGVDTRPSLGSCPVPPPAP